ncbi:polysaccharide pyruvyl transferase family protein [Pseudarthrobacter sp. NPDC089323]
MIRVLVANAYSSANSGDGLLVDETLDLIREAFGDNVQATLLASYPESFNNLGIPVIRSKPTRSGYDRAYKALLKTKFKDFDLIVGVGGGYLRAGSCTELVKTGLVMGPQLYQAARSSTPSVYLPQSIGPARLGSRRLLSALLKRLSTVWVRDDRSLEEYAVAGVQRSPDLAILGMNRAVLPFDSDAPIILTVRSHRGGVPQGIYPLRAQLGVIDSFIQSTVGGNNDTKAVESLLPRKVLESKALMAEASSARVVVAMRLHAALMALRAGHYVIHLSYERKGFGAFADLGLQEYVFNVHDFDPNHVGKLARDLAANKDRRHDYDLAIKDAFSAVTSNRSKIVASLRNAVGQRAR